jgi:hypothetical protein
MGRAARRRLHARVDRGEHLPLRSLPVNRDLIEFVRPACDLAVSRAVHDQNPPDFHTRLGDEPCPLCPDFTEQMRLRVADMLKDTDLAERAANLISEMDAAP